MGQRNHRRLLEALEDTTSVKDNVKLGYGDDDDVTIDWDGSELNVLPAADDTVINFGDGTLSCDLKWFGATASDYLSLDASTNELKPVGDLHNMNIVTAKTTAYTITTADFGKIFTTRGNAGSLTFTLPAASGNSGAVVEMYNVAGQTMIVAAADEEMVTFNDLTADSIEYSTASELIGGGFRCICDGTSWIVVALISAEAQTITVNSA